MNLTDRTAVTDHSAREMEHLPDDGLHTWNPSHIWLISVRLSGSLQSLPVLDCPDEPQSSRVSGQRARIQSRVKALSLVPKQISADAALTRGSLQLHDRPYSRGKAELTRPGPGPGSGSSFHIYVNQTQLRVERDRKRPEHS